MTNDSSTISFELRTSLTAIIKSACSELADRADMLLVASIPLNPDHEQ